MAIRNTFTASGNQTLDTLRRSISAALASFVNQINQQELVLKSHSTLPQRPEQGQTVLLTATDGSNDPGVYTYDGSNWLKLNN